MPNLDLKRLVASIRDTELIITPKYNQFLMQHGDDALPRAIADRIADIISTPPRVRSGSFSASSAGSCPRYQVLAYLGLPQVGAIDPRLQNIFDDGKWRHLRWQARLLHAGLLLDIEDPLIWPRQRSRGSMDGSGLVPDDHPRANYRGAEFGFELKGVTPYLFPRLRKAEQYKDEHAAQVARYFLMSGFEFFVILYEDKATQEWFEWVVTPDDVPVKEQRDELLFLNESVDDGVLPPVLPSCRKMVGPVFNDCPYGGRGGPCLKAGSWPRIKKGKK